MTKVEFHPEAEDDLAGAKQWYRQRSRLAARAFATEFAGAVRQIATSPTRWPKTHGETRRFVLSRFPFSILHKPFSGQTRERWKAPEAGEREQQLRELVSWFPHWFNQEDTSQNNV